MMNRAVHRGALSLLLTLLLSGCALFPPKLPSEVYEEGWRIVGENKIKGNWVIQVLDLPQRKLETLLLPEGTVPDARGHCISRTAAVEYNESAGVLVIRGWGHGATCDVWRYDLGKKTSKWIGFGQWRHVSGLAWSEDGKKLAFMAAGNDATPDVKAVGDASLYVYDLASEQLTKIADEGMIAYRSQISSPVWSEDGKFLYYVSNDRHIVRVELSSLSKEVLSINAYAVVTVKGDEIVYFNDHMPYFEEGCGAQLIRRRLKPDEEGDVHAVLLYTGGDVWSVLVSPSRRLVLMEDRRSYWGGESILIDTQTRDLYPNMWHYTTDKLFDMYATVCRAIPPGKAADDEAEAPQVARGSGAARPISSPPQARRMPQL